MKRLIIIALLLLTFPSTGAFACGGGTAGACSCGGGAAKEKACTCSSGVAGAGACSRGAANIENVNSTDKDTPLTMQQAAKLLQEGNPLYSCPMHTHVFSGDKDGRCPICGMNLSQVKEMKDGEAVFGDPGMQMDKKDMPMQDMKMESK